MTNLANYFERYKFDPSIANKSRTWFRQEVLLLKKDNINRQQLLTYGGKAITRVMPGNMYMYFYDPKYKDTLPFYDRFPLVFPFDTIQGGFIGLNMHYLPHKIRLMLFDKLLQFKTSKVLDEKTKLKYSYATVKRLALFPMAKHCIKSYLLDHVQSPIKMIPANHWTTALMLPVENFAKASTSKVWSTSAPDFTSKWQKSGGL